MLSRFGVLAALLTTTSMSIAQGAYITPPHAIEVEGVSSSGISFTNPKTRTQQTDSNLIGSSVVLIHSMAFRRTNSDSRAASTARTAEVQIDMGLGIPVMTNVFDSNYKTGSRQTVHPNKRVDLPDWRGATTTPAPFDLVFPFANPFLYDNREPVVWDILVDNGSGGGLYYMDWMNTIPPLTRGPKPEVLGVGCSTLTGIFTHTIEYSASSSELRVKWSAIDAPANSTVIPALGASDPNLDLGWCGNLRTDILVLLPAGLTDASGLATDTLKARWASLLGGVTLHTQLVSDNTGNPGRLAVSNGLRGTTPTVTGGGSVRAFKIMRLYDSADHGPAGNGPFFSAAPVLFTTN